MNKDKIIESIAKALTGVHYSNNFNAYKVKDAYVIQHWEEFIEEAEAALQALLKELPELSTEGVSNSIFRSGNPNDTVQIFNAGIYQKLMEMKDV